MNRGILACLLYALVSACGEGRHLDEGSDEPLCENTTWRAPTEGVVVCPQSSSCQCGGEEICCVEVAEGFTILGAKCSALTSCEGLAYECDGPEDCGADEICCAVMTSGGGSTCTTENECHGLDEYVMCRSDDDCGSLEHCLPASDDSYFEGDAAVCDL